MILNELLTSAVEKYPDKVALRYGQSAWTYRELNCRVRRLASALQNYPIGSGDKVALIACNSHRYLEVVFAGALAGAVTEHINGVLALPTILELLEDSTAKAVFLSKEFEHVALYLQQHLSRPILYVISDSELESELGVSYEEFLSNHDEVVPPVWDESEVLIQFYTSGTTGKPKGVMLTGENIRTQITQGCIEGRWIHDEIFLCCLPMYHTTSLAALQLMLVGGTLVISNGCKPVELIRLIQQYRVTRTTMVPHLIKSFVS
jgi:acyl-CoA synthetase (AMP-forming)/AMP-acid ligase II